MKTFLSVGEAMVEMSSADGANWRMGFAGDTLNTAWYVMQELADWRVSYFTALGADRYSEAMREFMADAGLCTDDILTIPDRRAGLYFIHQQDGDRHFTYWRDRSAAKLLARDPGLLAAVHHAGDTGAGPSRRASRCAGNAEGGGGDGLLRSEHPPESLVGRR